MTKQTAFNLVNDAGDVLTAAQAEDRLFEIIINPELAQRYWGELYEIDNGFHVVALLVNTSGRIAFSRSTCRR